MRLRITLFAIISGIFIPLNSANASSDEKSKYFFHTGTVSSICGAYSINAITQKNASMLLNSLIEIANKDLKDTKSRNAFNYFIKNGSNFEKYGCSKLIN